MASYLGIELFLGSKPISGLNHWLIPNEFWKPIQGYEVYQVSSIGRYKSSDRITSKKVFLEGRFLSNNCFGKKKYPNVALYKFDGTRPIYRNLHAIIAELFIPNPENKPEVNHKNGIKRHNWISNLEWNTTSENQIHAARTGLNPSPRLREAKNQKIILDTYTGIYYNSLHDVAETTNEYRSTITRRINRSFGRYIYA